MTTTMQCDFHWAGKPGWKGNGVARRGFRHFQLRIGIAAFVQHTKKNYETSTDEIFSCIKVYLRFNTKKTMKQAQMKKYFLASKFTLGMHVTGTVVEVEEWRQIWQFY
ncbi:MKRN2 opposite strand protein X3 [Biomphalaria glabrata]|nr:MKRN2 opposite strand protein X3 [Biomphalaria glabrata]